MQSVTETRLKAKKKSYPRLNTGLQSRFARRNEINGHREHRTKKKIPQTDKFSWERKGCFV